MCYHVSTPSLKDMVAFLDQQPAFTIDDYMPYYHVNGFSHPLLPIVASIDPTHITQAVWGLIPFWVKDEKKAKDTMKITLNAKSETMYTTPMYRDAAKRSRCLVIVNGFFEWRWEDENDKKCEKIPHFIYMPDGKPFTFGGLFTDWHSPDGGTIRTTSIITTQANELMASIHNSKKRMPLIMPEENWDTWLNPDMPSTEIMQLLRPFPEDGLQYHEIGKLITDRGVDSNTVEVQKPI